MDGDSQIVEALFRGHHHLVRGFVLGFLVGRGLPLAAYFDDDLNFHCHGRMEWIKIHVGLQTEDTFALISSTALAELQTALSQQPGAICLKLIDTRPVTAASFKFSYTAFTPEDGQRLLDLFRELPAGTALSPDYQPEVKVASSAKGIEVYTPVHDYHIRARGELSGAPEGVLRLAAYARKEPLIALGRVNLQY